MTLVVESGTIPRNTERISYVLPDYDSMAVLKMQTLAVVLSEISEAKL